MRNICNWETLDLDHIILEGADKLYKSLNIQNYFNVKELLGEIVVFSHTETLEISQKNLHEGIIVPRKPFLRGIFILFANVNDSTRCVLFPCSYAVVLVRHINYYGNVYYFLFDSHKRNSRAFTDDHPRYSILIKFTSLHEVET